MVLPNISLQGKDSLIQNKLTISRNIGNNTGFITLSSKPQNCCFVRCFNNGCCLLSYTHVRFPFTDQGLVIKKRAIGLYTIKVFFQKVKIMKIYNRIDKMFQKGETVKKFKNYTRKISQCTDKEWGKSISNTLFAWILYGSNNCALQRTM